MLEKTSLEKETRGSYEESLREAGLVPFKSFSLIELMLKRGLDIAGGLVGVIIFGFAAIILFIPYKCCGKRDRGPMLFKQQRYGYHGKIFYIYKFRTMIVDAEAYLDTHQEVYKDYREHGDKIANDPRITRLGSFIRMHSIDELPQFINILKGDMSLVGPRPLLLFEKEEYGDRFPYLELTKPGMTGYWATHGRNKIFFPERCDLELRYLEVHSFRFDVKTLFMTIVQEIKGSETY